MLTRSKGRASKAEAEANRPPIWALLPDELLLRVAELCFMPTLPTMSILDRRGKAAAADRLQSLKALYEFRGGSGIRIPSHTILGSDYDTRDQSSVKINQAGDTGMVVLARAIIYGAMPRVQLVHMFGSRGCEDTKITDTGIAILANAFALGGMVNTHELYLGNNQITDAGLAALTDGIVRGGLPNLKELVLYRNLLRNEGLKAFAVACRGGFMPKLSYLTFAYNQVGDAGVAALASACMAATSLPGLKELDVRSEHITDVGCTALTDSIGGGGFVALKELFLLDVAPSVSEDAKEQLKAACKTRGIVAWRPPEQWG